MTSLHELVLSSQQALGDRLEAELLIAHLLGKDRAWLYAHSRDLAPESGLAEALAELVQRRAHGEPMAYLLGYREFYGRNFKVGPGVLIPRPETELLIERALMLDLPERACVIDVGTGSGCIALSLAAERPDWRIAAVDLSVEALAVAADNRLALALSQVALLQADLLAGIRADVLDLVISNPPYVAPGDPHLAQGDLRFEPAIALSCGEDGMALIRALIEQATVCLRRRGWLWLEHGYDQAAQVRALLRKAGFIEIATLPDLAGIERVSGGRWPD